MRIKKAIAVLLCVAMVLSLISVEAFAATGTATVSVETTATNVQAGDTVNYTVYLGDCSGLASEGGLYNLDFNISIPAGLTFVAKSGVVDSNFATATGFGMPAFNEATMKFSSLGVLASGYVGGKIAVMTFSCTVNADAAGAKEVTLENVVFAVSSGTFTASVESATVKVPVPVDGISLDKTTLNLNLKNNKTAKLNATVTPDNADNKTVTWTSDKTSVATVANGVVTAVGVGTATITAKAGDKSATCTVTVVNCDHKNLAHYDAVAEGCTTNGNTEYWSCGDCDALFSDAAAKTPTTRDDVTIKAHHTLTDVAVKPATCTATGTIAHKHCSVCKKNFNESGKELENVTAAALGHTGGTADCKNLAVCTRCEQPYGELGNHKLATNVKKDATCTDPGHETYYSCTVDGCGKLFSDVQGKNEITEADTVINALGHDLKKVDAASATCTADGNNEYYKCSRCDKLFSDAEGNTETTVKDETLAALGHKMTKTEAKAATCTEAGNNEYYTCSRCNKVFKDKAGNTETTVAKETLAAKGHQMTKTEAEAATCTEDGYEAYWTCSACGKKFSDAEGKNEIDATVPVTKLGHAMTHHVRVEATCQKTGMNEYYECSRCKGLFRDDEGNDSVAAEALVIPLAAHTPSTGYAYTGTEHWQFCTACGATTTKALHDFTVDETTGTKTCNCGYVVYGEGSAPCDQHETKLVFDETHHWHVCKHCSYAEDKAAHGFGEWETDVEATATTDGLRHRTCEECGYVQQEVIAKPSTTPDRPNHRPSGGSATSSDKVQSSKTFDAGIAAYVGLSVLSLTGSALVIGKKKEF